MSQENVELVRSMYAAWERGDFSATDWAHPEIKYVVADGPMRGRWTGLRGLEAGWRSMINAWAGFRLLKATEYRALDDERVLVSSSTGGAGGRANWISGSSQQGEWVFSTCAEGRWRAPFPIWTAIARWPMSASREAVYGT